MISKFFIDRPVFASVLSLLIVLVGGVGIFLLPIDRYPEIVPPTIQIEANYPGADATTVAESVASPIEQELSGIPGLIYYSSTSANNGTARIVATFEIGKDQDLAAVQIQNRIARAEPRLPQEVVRQGITVTRATSNILTVVTLRSDDPADDDIYLSNYATIHVQDPMRRVPGVGDVTVFGARDYAMRIWLDPDKLVARGLTVADVAQAIREQNAQFPAGTVGQRPVGREVELTVPVVTHGRLRDVEQYEQIILRARPDGEIVRLSDVARIELGARSYDLFGRVSGQPSALMLVFLQTGANAIDTIQGVRDTMADLSRTLPPSLHLAIPFDTTEFIRESIQEVVLTLAEAIGLVVAVVFLFLQSWRATLIPLLAVPVSIVGAFAGMYVLGFSINTLTLFGLVLAIGIVVDDAIVVVENVERILRERPDISVRDATVLAMRQVTGPIIAVVLVLTAVFVPVAFLGGLTGQIYRQFAITIAVSVAISGLVALTLSPALCRLLLKREHGKKWAPFRWFERGFDAVTHGYTEGVRRSLRHALVTLLVFGAIAFGTWRLSRTIPTGFLPQEDQGYVVTIVRLPDGASLSRTDGLARQVEQFVLQQPAVGHVVTLGGYDILSGRVNSPNAAVMFVSLKPFGQRQEAGMSAGAVAGAVMQRFGGAPEGLVLALSPPPIQGLGTRAGFEMELQALSDTDIEKLADVGNAFSAAAEESPVLAQINSALRVGVPQLVADVDRARAKMMGVSIADVFDTMQTFFGSLYVNDFNKFGRIWRVVLQAEPRFRDQPEDLAQVHVRNAAGEMVPLSGLLNTRFAAGPNVVTHFNGLPAIQITGGVEEGHSSGEGLRAVRDIAQKTLPDGYTFAWSGASYQEVEAGNKAPIVLLFGLIVVFLVLAAQYEQWSLPIAVLLSVPVAAFGALLAIWLRGLPQDIYFQIGLLTLVGLAAKNAILMVEFAVSAHRQGQSRRDAAITAARLRFRPIVMTSLAFVLGVLPLAIASGAGAAARHSIGTGVIGGMLAATFLAVFFVPLFFVGIEAASETLWQKTHRSEAPPPA